MAELENLLLEAAGRTSAAVKSQHELPPSSKHHGGSFSDDESDSGKALDLYEVSDCRSIAHYIKQKFDESYGPAWHCVVGKDFGSSITHLCGSFIFFHVEMMEFLIFKDGTDSSESREEAIGVLQNGSLSD